MEYYGNNDWRDYHLAHYGVLGMKWGVRKQRPTSGGGRSLSDFVRKKIGKPGFVHKKIGRAISAVQQHKVKKRNKAIDRYKKKYNLTDKQAGDVYDYGKAHRYTRRDTDAVAKRLKKSYGNVTVAASRAQGARFLKKVVKSAVISAALRTPQGRKLAANGARFAAKILGKTVRTTAKAARAAGNATQRAKDAYWHFNPKHAPKQSVVDAVWREVSSDPIRRRALGNVPRLTMK